MRRLNHITPSYIACRSLFWLNQKRFPNDPWITKKSIDILESLLRPQDKGIEWGSGRSTIWLAHRLEYLTSIENNTEWFSFVSTRLKEENIQNVSYHHCSLVDTANNSTSQYVDIVNSIEDESLQFALVDGRLRDICALSAIPKLVQGGILVIDNVERYLPSPSKSPEAIGLEEPPASDTWTAVHQQIKTWRKIWTTNGVVDTCIFIKPCQE